jgi:chemotaxis protein MotB
MARKKQPETPPNHERWLVSYGDFITLLFAVFVTLYAMSQVDKQKLGEVAASYRDAFSVTPSGQNAKAMIPKTDVISIPKVNLAPIPYGQYRTAPSSAAGRQNNERPFAGKEDFRAIMEALRKKLAAAGAADSVEVHVSARGLVASLQGSIFFEPGKGTLNAASSRILLLIADSLSPYANPVSCEGHTDDTPVSSRSFASNWELSAARAASVASNLAENGDFRAERLSVVGYGEYRPVADNNSDAGRQRNNRVEIILLGKDGSVREESPGEPSATRQPPLM